MKSLIKFAAKKLAEATIPTDEIRIDKTGGLLWLVFVTGGRTVSRIIGFAPANGTLGREYTRYLKDQIAMKIGEII